MTSAVQLTSRRPRRGLLLLVLAVLTGVLAMHGLGPGPLPRAGHEGAGGGHGAATVHEFGEHRAAVAEETAGCTHDADGSGHVEHADATCAASGVGAPYAPPALAAAVDGSAALAVPPLGAARSTERLRAPPDLAELQLLRI